MQSEALEVPTDIRENIAYFKKWKDATKAQAMRPFSEYPKMPLVPARWAKDTAVDGKIIGKKGELSGKAPVPIFDTFKQPIVFATARDEAEWLADHPAEAAEIAEIEAGLVPATDKLEASNQALQAVTDRLKGAKAEIEQKDTALAEALAQLETAKLQLAAKRREADPAKLDMRTKEGREAAAALKTAEG
jgi:hypothetical protein